MSEEKQPKKMFDASVASAVAIRLVDALSDHCEMIDICGSLRRCRPSVHDIDIVLSPKLTEIVAPSAQASLFAPAAIPFWKGFSVIKEFFTDFVVPVTGYQMFDDTSDKLKGCKFDFENEKSKVSLDTGLDDYINRKVNLVLTDKTGRGAPWDGLPVELYICEPLRYEMVRFIRTGSKEHNVKIATTARNRGMKIHADGLGFSSLKNPSIFLNVTSEEMLFDRLQMKYVPPEEREDKGEF